MDKNEVKRSIFQRIFGVCATKLPEDPGCWIFSDNTITVDLKRSKELSDKGGALRIEGGILEDKRLLVVHGNDGEFYAFENTCTHGKRRLDPVPGAKEIQCCSVGRSTFDYEGKLVSKGDLSDLKTFEVKKEEESLRISL